MHFWRIVDNVLYKVNDTDNLGFTINDPSYIPDEYLDDQKFCIMRTCHGIGDWGIISAMPRLLKEKYPKCTVQVPSEMMMNTIFGDNNTKHKMSNVIFKNNPYVDDFIDSVDGDVYHDHYRIYDDNNANTPLINQILKFWQFDANEYVDNQPEIYWTSDEKKLGNDIIDEYVGGGKFGCLLLSDRYDYKRNDMISKYLRLHRDIKWLYWTSKPLSEIDIYKPEFVLDMRHIDIRVQLYIKSKATLNLGSQTGMTQTVARYSNLLTIQRQFPIGSNYVKGEIYI
jgi:hypothetical protein